MQVTPVQFDPTSITTEADLLRPRSSGLHLSQIYHDLESTIAKKKRKPMEQEQLDAYRGQGFLFEHLMSLSLAKSLTQQYLVRPEEVELDGITGSPDLIDLRTMAVWDTKCTYKSFNKMGNGAEGLSADFWLWKVQLMGYCRMLDSGTAVIAAVFINGDYKMFQPLFKMWELEFSKRELDENWQMLVGHAKSRGWL